MSEKGIEKYRKKIKKKFIENQNQSEIELNRQCEGQELGCLRSSLQCELEIGSESGRKRRKCSWRVDEGAAICLVMAVWEKVCWQNSILLATTEDFCEAV